MLTRQQQQAIENLIQATVEKLNKFYESILPKKESAAEIVKSILNAICTITSIEQLDNFLEDYTDVKDDITFLAHLRFADTALQALSSRQINLIQNNIDAQQLGAEIAEVANQSLRVWLQFQNTHIKAAAMSDDLVAQTNRLEKETAESRKEIERLDKKICEAQENIKTIEERRRERGNKISLQLGIINNNDRPGWINESPFKDELIKVQETIKRLDSFFVWNGRNKAAKIRKAFNDAIDAAITGAQKFNNFEEFKNYKKSGLSSLFFAPKNQPSLDDALSEHRWFKTIDDLRGVTPKSKI